MNCIICYDEIKSDGIECKICHNKMHRECFKQTESYKCPYCRNLIAEDVDKNKLLREIVFSSNIKNFIGIEDFYKSIYRMSYISKTNPHVVKILQGENPFTITDDMDKYDALVFNIMIQHSYGPFIAVPHARMTETNFHKLVDEISQMHSFSGKVMNDEEKNDILNLLSDYDINEIWNDESHPKHHLIEELFHKYAKIKYTPVLELREYHHVCCFCNSNNIENKITFSRNLLPHDKDWKKIIFCKDCKRAYVAEKFRSRRTSPYNVRIYRAEPNYEDLIDGFNYEDVIYYSAELKRKLLPESELRDLLVDASFDMKSINEKIFERLLKNEINVCLSPMLIGDLILPELLISKYKDLIVRKLRGDDISVDYIIQLWKLFK